MLFDVLNIDYFIKKQQILKKINFHFDKLEHQLILGSSGCGKTTLLNLMAGLIRPTTGEISFKEKKYSELSQIEIDQLRADNFGFIFQKLHLIDYLTVEQNIAIIQQNLDNKIIIDLIDSLGLSAKRKRLVRELSFGEAQRVAIARGLANQPKVVFADEPTSALDNKNTKNVMDLILSYAKKLKITLIVCTHDERIKHYFTNSMDLSDE